MGAIGHPGADGWRQRGDVLAAGFVCVIILMLLIPLPALVLDLFMALNICLSLLVILIVLYARNALEFTIFPTLLLLATMFGLALNVSSTRLILSQGASFDGRIVRAFGSFVVGASGVAGYVIGLIIFTIIIAVQFVVITKGSTRVAEVAARFTLDALPGRQMAIDAEYNSGLLTEAQATARKDELQRRTDFYGAMDGASKFVSGNVRVAILITLVNLAGGLIIGVSIHGEPLAAAARTYVALTIGDGLVTQLPALLISTATGIIVTRAISDASFGADVARQFSRSERPFYITGGFLAVLALLPGFPPYLLLPLAAAIAGLGFMVRRGLTQADRDTPAAAGAAAAAGQPVTGGGFGAGNGAARATRTATSFAAGATATVAATTAAAPAAEAAVASDARTRGANPAPGPVMPPDPLSLELGYALVACTEGEQGAELLERIAHLRRQVALDRGLWIPHLRITDNLQLAPNAYVVKIRGVEMGRGFQRGGGVDRMVAHLGEIVDQRAAELLGRDEVRSMLDILRADYPTTVEEATAALSVGEIQRVLQGLLAEQVSIRDLVAILETLADFAPAGRETGFLVQQVRRTLGRQISLQHVAADGVLRVVTLAPEVERQLLAAASGGATARDAVSGLAPGFQRQWIDALSRVLARTADESWYPAVVTSEQARTLVKWSTRREIPQLVCLAASELAQEVAVESLGEVRLAAGDSADGVG